MIHLIFHGSAKLWKSKTNAFLCLLLLVLNTVKAQEELDLFFKYHKEWVTLMKDSSIHSVTSQELAWQRAIEIAMPIDLVNKRKSERTALILNTYNLLCNDYLVTTSSNKFVYGCQNAKTLVTQYNKEDLRIALNLKFLETYYFHYTKDNLEQQLDSVSSKMINHPRFEELDMHEKLAFAPRLLSTYENYDFTNEQMRLFLNIYREQKIPAGFTVTYQ